MMKELTDLEICIRIADIKSISYLELSDCILQTSEPDGSGVPQEVVGKYNPLTDDALCFNIAFTHKVKIDYFDECAYIALKRKLTRQSFNKNDISSLRKAICLAIIQAHE